MINPDKLYATKSIGVLIHIDPENKPYFRMFKVNLNGKIYEGFLSDIPNWQRFTLNQKVKIKVQYNIMGEQFYIKSMRRVLK